MTHTPRNPQGGTKLPPDAQLDAELGALAQDSRRDLKTLDELAALGPRAASTREGRSMTSNPNPRRWWIPVAAAAGLAAALFFVPISYDKTMGQEVRLDLGAVALDEASLSGLAHTMEEALDSEGVRVEVDESTVLTARVEGRSMDETRAIAAALARTLEANGVAARATVTPWTERVSDNLYAYAAGQMQWIRVETAGRSAAEIEADLRSQLQAAGFVNPEVSVQKNGGETRVDVTAGTAEGGRMEKHVIRKIEGGDGSEPALEMPMLDLSSVKGKSDAEIQAEVERQLRARGIEAEVTVRDGRIEVEARKEVHK